MKEEFEIKNIEKWQRYISQGRIYSKPVDVIKNEVWQNLQYYSNLNSIKKSKTSAYSGMSLINRILSSKLRLASAGVFSVLAVASAFLITNRLTQKNTLLEGNYSFEKTENIQKESQLSKKLNLDEKNTLLKMGEGSSFKYLSSAKFNILLLESGSINFSSSKKLDKPLLLSTNETSVLITGTTVRIEKLDNQSTKIELLEGSVSVFHSKWMNGTLEISNKKEFSGFNSVKVHSDKSIETLNEINSELVSLFETAYKDESGGNDSIDKKLVVMNILKEKKTYVVPSNNASKMNKTNFSKEIELAPMNPMFKIIMKNKLEFTAELVSQNEEEFIVKINNSISRLKRSQVESIKEL